MSSVTAQDLLNVFDNATDSTTELEYVMQLAIDTLNILGANISSLSGVAGSKTVTLTSPQRGAVIQVSRVIYNSVYKNAENNPSVAVSAINYSTADLMSNPNVWQMIKDIAELIKDPDTTRFRLKFKACSDTTGI